MKTLKQCLEEASEKKVAIGHFNISDIVALKAIFHAAKDLGVPVFIGTSEGEREFVGARQAVALVKSLRDEYDYPIFINADHTYSFEKIKEAVAAGYDSVIFDGAKLSMEENLKQTKEVVEYVRAENPEILVEGELGYIGSSSKLLDAIPAGAAQGVNLTTAEEAKKFVEMTGVDLFAPAVGNIHGMLKNMSDPRLNIQRIAEIAGAVSTPLVLHGGSGNSDEDFQNAIAAGIRMIHINTEIRVAWKKGVEDGLREGENEVAPYKLLTKAHSGVYDVVFQRLKLFNHLR